MDGLNNLWFKSHEEIKIQSISNSFYPTTLKGHGVWMGRWAGGGKKFVRPVSRKL